MSKKCLELIGYMEMFIRNRVFIFVFMFSLSILIVNALENPYELIVTNNKDIEAKMLFLDKLSSCTKHMYHAEPSGIYEIYGKKNNACSLKWTLAMCDFPEGVYQEFSRVQRIRTIERINRLSEGYRIELKDKNYRYLFNTGNKYCKIIY